MKFDFKEIGIYAIIIVLIWEIYRILTVANKDVLYLILIVVSLVSIFWKYKFNWIVTSLPFFFIIIRLLSSAWFPELAIFVSLPYIACILYLFIKKVGKFENLIYEIIFAIIILVLMLSKFLIPGVW